MEGTAGLVWSTSREIGQLIAQCDERRQALEEEEAAVRALEAQAAARRRGLDDRQAEFKRFQEDTERRLQGLVGSPQPMPTTSDAALAGGPSQAAPAPAPAAATPAKPAEAPPAKAKKAKKAKPAKEKPAKAASGAKRKPEGEAVEPRPSEATPVKMPCSDATPVKMPMPAGPAKKKAKTPAKEKAVLPPFVPPEDPTNVESLKEAVAKVMREALKSDTLDGQEMPHFTTVPYHKELNELVFKATTMKFAGFCKKHLGIVSRKYNYTKKPGNPELNSGKRKGKKSKKTPAEPAPAEPAPAEPAPAEPAPPEPVTAEAAATGEVEIVLAPALAPEAAASTRDVDSLKEELSKVLKEVLKEDSLDGQLIPHFSHVPDYGRLSKSVSDNANMKFSDFCVTHLSMKKKERKSRKKKVGTKAAEEATKQLAGLGKELASGAGTSGGAGARQWRVDGQPTDAEYEAFTAKFEELVQNADAKDDFGQSLNLGQVQTALEGVLGGAALRAALKRYRDDKGLIVFTDEQMADMETEPGKIEMFLVDADVAVDDDDD